MCSPSGGGGTAPGAAATTSQGSVMNANGTPAPPMPTGAGASGAGAAPAATPGVAPLFIAMAAIQAVQAIGSTYGARQSFKAQQYVDDVHRKTTLENAQLSLNAANDQQAVAESTDKSAQGIEQLTSKVNALKTRSAIKVSAGESGVTGTTPGDILSDADRIQAAREGVMSMNYASRQRERLAQRQGIMTSYLNNRAGANTPYRPDPTNLGATGLEIAGNGLSTYMDYQRANREGASRAQGAA